VCEYRVGDAILSQCERDYRVNLRLLEDGWEVSEGDVYINDFEFPPQYREITRDEAYAMLDKPEEERRVQVTDNLNDLWVERTLVGVNTGGLTFRVKHKHTGKFDCYTYCRVKV
jgi:hypothetical protein